jgi:hypothetical protein
VVVAHAKNLRSGLTLPLAPSPISSSAFFQASNPCGLVCAAFRELAILGPLRGHVTLGAPFFPGWQQSEEKRTVSQEKHTIDVPIMTNPAPKGQLSEWAFNSRKRQRWLCPPTSEEGRVILLKTKRFCGNIDLKHKKLSTKICNENPKTEQNLGPTTICRSPKLAWVTRRQTIWVSCYTSVVPLMIRALCSGCRLWKPACLKLVIRYLFLSRWVMPLQTYFGKLRKFKCIGLGQK